MDDDGEPWEGYLPSEIARLVLGYLYESDSPKAAKLFKEECPSLSEYRALLKQRRKLPLTLRSKSLTQILQHYYSLTEGSSDPGGSVRSESLSATTLALSASTLSTPLPNQPSASNLSSGTSLERRGRQSPPPRSKTPPIVDLSSPPPSPPQPSNPRRNIFPESSSATTTGTSTSSSQFRTPTDIYKTPVKRHVATSMTPRTTPRKGTPVRLSRDRPILTPQKRSPTGPLRQRHLTPQKSLSTTSLPTEQPSISIGLEIISKEIIQNSPLIRKITDNINVVCHDPTKELQENPKKIEEVVARIEQDQTFNEWLQSLCEEGVEPMNGEFVSPPLVQPRPGEVEPDDGDHTEDPELASAINSITQEMDQQSHCQDSQPTRRSARIAQQVKHDPCNVNDASGCPGSSTTSPCKSHTYEPCGQAATLSTPLPSTSQPNVGQQSNVPHPTQENTAPSEMTKRLTPHHVAEISGTEVGLSDGTIICAPPNQAVPVSHVQQYLGYSPASEPTFETLVNVDPAVVMPPPPPPNHISPIKITTSGPVRLYAVSPQKGVVTLHQAVENPKANSLPVVNHSSSSARSSQVSAIKKHRLRHRLKSVAPVAPKQSLIPPTTMRSLDFHNQGPQQTTLPENSTITINPNVVQVVRIVPNNTVEAAEALVSMQNLPQPQAPSSSGEKPPSKPSTPTKKTSQPKYSITNKNVPHKKMPPSPKKSFSSDIRRPPSPKKSSSSDIRRSPSKSAPRTPKKSSSSPRKKTPTSSKERKDKKEQRKRKKETTPSSSKDSSRDSKKSKSSKSHSSSKSHKKSHKSRAKEICEEDIRDSPLSPSPPLDTNPPPPPPTIPVETPESQYLPSDTSLEESSSEEEEKEPPKKKRGRPPGSLNKRQPNTSTPVTQNKNDNPEADLENMDIEEFLDKIHS